MTPTAEQIKRARGIAEDWFGPESEGAWAWVLVDGKSLADDIAFALAAEAALALEQRWRPIDIDAPKDYPILLRCDDFCPITGMWSRDQQKFVGDNGVAYPFTHYALIPSSAPEKK